MCLKVYVSACRLMFLPAARCIFLALCDDEGLMPTMGPARPSLPPTNAPAPGRSASANTVVSRMRCSYRTMAVVATNKPSMRG